MGTVFLHQDDVELLAPEMGAQAGRQLQPAGAAANHDNLGFARFARGLGCHAATDTIPVARFRNSHDLYIGLWRISESKAAGNLLIPSVVPVSKFARSRISVIWANFEPATLGGFPCCAFSVR